MFSDLGTIFTWWLCILGIGIIFLPATGQIFNRFFDKGYLFAKVLGIAVSSYLVWFLGSLKISPFSQQTIWLVLALGLIANLFLVLKNQSLISSNRPLLSIWFLEEVMFFIALAAWSFVRGFQPDIQGLEKFMDFGFVNSILKSQYFPPADMWFAGKPINYYYFGHFVAAFLTRLTGITSAITYNLMVATVFAFTFSLTFSLVANLIYFLKDTKPLKFTKKFAIVGGIISALLICLGANLHPAYYNLKMKLFHRPYCDSSYSYWYPNATRYIGYCPNVEDKTIHEFPSYSFIVSDLHGHVSDIPFVLFFLALSFGLLIYLKENGSTVFSFQFLVFSLPASLMLAIMYMTNQWDFPIYALVLGVVVFIGFFSNHRSSFKTFFNTAAAGIIFLIPIILLVLPFQLNFETLAKGVGFVNANSLPHQLLILWGAPWLFGTAYLIFVSRNRKKITLSDFFVLTIFFVSTLLIAIPEIIYLKDIYIVSYHRANTMFKLTYQSFIMYTLVMGYVFVRLVSALKNTALKIAATATSLTLFFALLIYPNYSIPGYYGKINPENYKGLYGLGFMEKQYPDDFKAVAWMNRYIKGQPVVLEAAGDSYTDYCRISMATGLPTIQGWLVHEWLWRGSFDEPGARAEEVKTIYESRNLEEIRKLLEKYQVKYVLVSDMERQKYPQIYEKKFSELGKIVFQSGRTYLFEIETATSKITPEDSEIKVELTSSPIKYIVKKGDSLWKISEKVFGSGYLWVQIYKENKLRNPGLIYENQVLTIPPVLTPKSSP
jgi:uncharacterized membrane protein